MIVILHANLLIDFVSGWKWYSGIKVVPLLSPAELSVSVKENPDGKKNEAHAIH